MLFPLAFGSTAVCIVSVACSDACFLQLHQYPPRTQRYGLNSTVLSAGHNRCSFEGWGIISSLLNHITCKILSGDSPPPIETAEPFWFGVWFGENIISLGTDLLVGTHENVGTFVDDAKSENSIQF